MDKIRAAIYVRVSTDRQEYTRQINELLGYAERHNMEIVNVFEEKESGFNSDRPEYNKLIKLTKEDIDTVMIWELSRLSRKSIEIQTDIESFTKKGINVFVYNKNLNTLNSDGTEAFTTKLIVSIIATMAEDEVKTSKQRSKSAKQHYVLNVGRSYTSQAAFGYDLINKHLYVNESEAALVQRVFQLSIDGNSQYSIAMQLNSEGIRTRKGNMWPSETISTMLKNTAYFGKAKYSLNATRGKSEKINCKNSRKVTEYTYVDCPAIISKETFDLSAEKRKERRCRSASSIGFSYLLKHLLICHSCNNYYTYDRTHNYMYKCARKYNRARNDGIKCTSAAIDGARIEYMVWETVKHYCHKQIREERLTLQLEPLRNEIELKKQQIEGIDKHIERLVNVANQIVNAAIDIKVRFPDMPSLYDSKLNEADELNRDAKRHNKEKENMLNQLKKAEDKIKLITELKTSVTDLDDIDYDRKYDLIHRIVESIKIYKESSRVLALMRFKAGQIIYICYYPLRSYFFTLDHTPELYFDESTKTGTVVTHTIDDKVDYDFSGYKEYTRTYNIKDFVDSFDTPDKREMINL